MSATDDVDRRIGKVIRERTTTRDAIARKLAEVANLRTTYAHQGVRLDTLLEERTRAVVADALVQMDAMPPHTGQDPVAGSQGPGDEPRWPNPMRPTHL